MRRLVAAALVLAAAGVAPSAGGAPSASASLTFVVQVQFGGGTGLIYSPVALCDASDDGTVLRRLSDMLGAFGAPAWSRDGSRLAFVSYEDATRRFSIQVTPAGSWRPVAVARSTAQLQRPSWSPDGSRIAYASLSKKAPGVYVVGADGKGNRRLYAGAASGPSWSPDGTRIAFAATGIRVIGADGSNLRTLSADGIQPAWSTDGKRIAFVATVGQFLDQDLFTMAADGTGRTRLTNTSPSRDGGTVYIGTPAWSPDGAQIAVAHTVEHDYGKGSYYVRNVLLVDPGTGAATSFELPLAFAEPAWRPAPAPTAADAAARPCAILTGDAAATVKGTAYDDLIVTGKGNDSVDGAAGNDWIETSTGNDRIAGGPGRDEIWSGPGTDRELVRDGVRDVVHCGDFRDDTVVADRKDVALGRCKAVSRR